MPIRLQDEPATVRVTPDGVEVLRERYPNHDYFVASIAPNGTANKMAI